MDDVLAVGLGSNDRGGLVAVALASDGRLHVAGESLPGEEWTAWGLLGSPPDQLLNSGAVLAGSPDGDLLAVAVDTAGNLRAVLAPDSTSGWGAWENAGAPGSGSGFGGPVAATWPSEDVAAVVAPTVDGKLFQIERSSGRWGSWTQVPATGVPSGVGFTAGIAVAGAGGELVAAAVGSNATVYVATCHDGSWRPWQPIASTGLPDSQPVGPLGLASDGQGTLTVVAVAGDGQAYVTTGNAAVADPGATWDAWQSLAHPSATPLRPSGTTTIGFQAEYDSRLTVLAPGNDGNAYRITQTAPGGWPATWNPLGDPDDPSQLWSDTAQGPNTTAVAVVAPQVTAGSGRPRPADQRPIPTAALSLTTPVPSSGTTFTVPEGAPFLAGAVFDSVGEFPAGISVTVLDPDGQPLAPTKTPSAPSMVVGEVDGAISYFLIKEPAAGAWTLQISSVDVGEADFQAWLSSTPSLHPVSSLATTIEDLCDGEALAALGLSWKCIACKAGLVIGAAALVAAIVVGVAFLTPESAVVVWLAEQFGVTGEAALAFVVDHLSEVRNVFTVAERLCQWLHACA